ncbi:hypothetical protein [Acidipropionibacterium jensenii]|nr:hypothetical protein [Acidipropionibacterium jensenii]MDN6811334.1 hypothetical protein [Acidipropionibacterium jensenii]
MIILITVLAVAVGVAAYQFGVSLRTSAGPAITVTTTDAGGSGQENPSQEPS